MSTTVCVPASPDPNGCARRHPRLRWGVVLTAILLLLALSARAQGLADQDASQPIEVVADELQVDQTRNVAIFRGNVEAIQGTLVLRADEVTVVYDLESEGTQTIRRIEAKGRVLLTSPEESAEAREGVYDVTAGRIVLRGDVVLTRRDNVVRGRQLVVDLRRHVATVEGGGERVRALFRPEQLRPQTENQAEGQGAAQGETR